MEAPEKIYVPTEGDELHYHMTCPNNNFKKVLNTPVLMPLLRRLASGLRKI